MSSSAARESSIGLQLVTKLPFESNEDKDPRKLWEKCIEFQKRWETESPSSERMSKRMTEFRNQKAINLVWMSNKLAGTLPEGASEFETYRMLTSLLDETANAESAEPLRRSESGESSEDNRTSQRQLVQHMQAYRRLEKAVQEGEELSEELIKETHGILMDGLKNGDQTVEAGAYRKIHVFADNHQFPHHDYISTVMPSIVSDYSSKSSDPSHDPYQLASWLLYEVISLHPFEDGNGRLCRLLWCYSLMRDGLPFPTVLTSGHKKAYKHYINALKRSQRTDSEDHPHLTSLTVLSVYLAWDNFFFNWEKYEKQTQ